MRNREFLPWQFLHTEIRLSYSFLEIQILRYKMDQNQMICTSSHSFVDPVPPTLQPVWELRLFLALSPIQFACLTDKRPILPDPYSLRFGLRSDPLKAFERAHYFMTWSAPYAEPPPAFSIKKFMLCSVVFSPQGVLTLLLSGALEKGDGVDPNRSGYWRMRGPMFYELRGSDPAATLLYKFDNQYSELV